MLELAIGRNAQFQASNLRRAEVDREYAFWIARQKGKRVVSCRGNRKAAFPWRGFKRGQQNIGVFPALRITNAGLRGW